MEQVYNLISDGELIEELSANVRNRNLEQKFLYLSQGASLYNQNKQDNKEVIGGLSKFIEHTDICEFGKKHNISSPTRTAFISLWCGNAIYEKNLFQNVWHTGISYFGVDSSREMLFAASESLAAIDIEKHYICSDFGSNIFRREIGYLTRGFDRRIFTFFSNTFWNINQTNIIDILYNILDPWEMIWLDVCIRKWLSAKDDLEMFNIYKDHLKNPESLRFFANILDEIWIPLENWEFWIQSVLEPWLNAIRLQIYFAFKERTIISIRWDMITILPGEKLKILDIYLYDVEWLIKFFEGHNFILVDQQIKELSGQFIFKRL